MRSKPAPFDDSDYLFELKYDGFRALAYLENGHCRLVTFHGHFGQLLRISTDDGQPQSVLPLEAIPVGRILVDDSASAPV